MGNPKEKIKITFATPQDAKGVQEVFYRTWLATYPNEEFGITVDDIEDRYKNSFTDEGLKKRVEKIVNPSKGEKLFLAKDGEKIIGLCIIKCLDKNQLQAIYILPEHQGKGIGHLFWNKVKKSFAPNKDIVVEVATYNIKAINFYKKLGFEDTGRRFFDERHRMKSGAVIPEMEMLMKVKQWCTRE
jgi:ribosomal protein S18 acetylase RimI-like enzyme